MPSIPNPASSPPVASQPKPPPQRTQVMDAAAFARSKPIPTPSAQPVPPSVQWAPPQRFGYAPGARVNVTWSNGQRYPATVSQVSGTQCLVVFPDGQQHWVEMQYLSPG
jgi:hypothetical protein